MEFVLSWVLVGNAAAKFLCVFLWAATITELVGKENI